MKTKIFTKNENGKIEFTEKELKKLLDEIYDEGYNDCRNKNYIYTTPYKWPYWNGTYYYTTCNSDGQTASSSYTINNDNKYTINTADSTTSISNALNSTSTSDIKLPKAETCSCKVKYGHFYDGTI